MTGGPNTETGHPAPVQCQCVLLTSSGKPGGRCAREVTPPALVCSACAGGCQTHEDMYGLQADDGTVRPSLEAQRKADRQV